MENTANTTTRVPRTVRNAWMYPSRVQPAARRKLRIPEAVTEGVGGILFWVVFFFSLRFLMYLIC